MNLRRVYRAIVAVGMAVVVARLAQIARDLAIAGYLGVSVQADAFFLALLLPMHLINVISGSISIAFVPRLIKVEEEGGEEAAHRLIEATAAMSLALLVTTGLITAIGFPLVLPYLADRLPGGSAELARNLYWILVPMLVMSGMATVWSGILTAKEKFALPSIVPVITPLVVLALLPIWPVATRVYGIAAGTSLGACLEVAVIGMALKRRGYKLLPRWHGWSDSVRELGRDIGPLVLGTAILTLVSLVPQFMAARLGEGSVSVLSYGQKVTTVLTSIAGVAVATVTQAFFSKLVAQRQWDHLRSSLNRISVVAVAVLGVVTAFGILFAEPMIRVLFQRGQFLAEDTVRVAPVHALFAIQIPWAALSLAHYRLVAALGARRLLWQVPAGGVLVLVALAPILMSRYGVAGLALDVSVFHVLSSVAYWVILNRFLIPRESTGPAPDLEMRPSPSP